MPLDTSMPAWLTQRAGDAFRQNTAGATELGQDARSTIGAFVPFLQTIQDQQQNLKTEGMKLNLASASLGIQQQAQGIEITKMKMLDQEQGAKEFPEWLKQTGGSWQKALVTPFTGTSQSGAAQVAKVQEAAWKTGITQQATDLKKQQVEIQLGAQKLKADQAAAALEEAKRNHDLIHSDKLAADAIRTKTVADFQPDVKPLADGSQLIHVSPERWQYVAAPKNGGKTQDLSTAQMIEISKSLKAANPDDPTAKIIDDALSNKVKAQLMPGAKPAPAASGKPAQSDIDYLIAHPEMADKFNAQFGKQAADQYLP